MNKRGRVNSYFRAATINKENFLRPLELPKLLLLKIHRPGPPSRNHLHRSIQQTLNILNYQLQITPFLHLANNLLVLFSQFFEIDVSFRNQLQRLVKVDIDLFTYALGCLQFLDVEFATNLPIVVALLAMLPPRQCSALVQRPFELPEVHLDFLNHPLFSHSYDSEVRLNCLAELRKQPLLLLA
jgi:hypothetical protein